MKRNPELEIYLMIAQACKALGHNFYTHSPRKEVQMPFIKLGGSQLLPAGTKDSLIGKARVSLDAWSKVDDRSEPSDIAVSILEELASREFTQDGFRIYLVEDEASIEVYPDQSTENDLWRAHMSLTFEFI